MKYEFIEHTADVKIKAKGKTLQEAFSNSAIGFTKFLTKSRIKPNITKQISVEGADLKSLLYNFIEEFIVLFDSEYFLISKIKNIKIIDKKNKSTLKANIIGDINKNYKINSSVKAITYDDMQIQKEDGEYNIVFTLDI